MVPGSAWPGACNCPARCIRSRRGAGARFTGATICPAVSAPNTPRRIRPVVSTVFAPLHPARSQPGIAGNHWPAYSQPLGELPPRGLRFRSASGALHHGWRNGGFGGLPEHIRMATRQAASGAPLAPSLPAPAPATLPLGASGLPAIGFLARFRFGLQLFASAFTLQPRSACSAALVSRQDYLRAPYRCFAVQARYVKLPQLPPVACQYRGAYRQALQCAERMFVDFRLNGQVQCRRPVGQFGNGDNRSAWEFAPLFRSLIAAPQCGHTPQHIVHALARWLGFGFGVNVLPVRLWCNVLAIGFWVRGNVLACRFGFAANALAVGFG
jgi:hypothetical protein